MTARIVDQPEAGPNVAVAAPRVQPRRVVFAIGHMGPGGAQRVVANAANALVERGLEMHIVTLSQTPPDAYHLHPAIVRHRLGGAPKVAEGTSAGSDTRDKHRGVVKRALRPGVLLAFAVLLRIKRSLRALKRGVRVLLRRSGLSRDSVRVLRTTLEVVKPDCVFSFLTRTNVIMLMATRGMEIRTVISERNDPRLQRHPGPVEAARRLLYRRATIVTANTRGALEALEPYVPKEKLAFLPNPLNLPADRRVADFEAPTFVTVARLVEQKGIDILVRAAAIALPGLPGWRLAVVGDGPLRADLQALASELGVASRIDWIGHVDDPFPYLRASRFFVLPSRFEGSPNALLEAMSCGLASVVTDASPGPLELIGADSAGLVVPVDDWEAMSRGIISLARDEPLRERLSEEALKRSEPHLPEVALRTWLEVIA